MTNTTGYTVTEQFNEDGEIFCAVTSPLGDKVCRWAGDAVSFVEGIARPQGMRIAGVALVDGTTLTNVAA